MTRLARPFALATGIATVSAAGFAIAQGTATASCTARAARAARAARHDGPDVRCAAAHAACCELS